MWGIKTWRRIVELETDLRALRKDFQTLEAYVDDRLRLTRNAENRIRVKSAKMDEDGTQQEPVDVAEQLSAEMPAGLTPRQRLIQKQILLRRAGLRTQ